LGVGKGSKSTVLSKMEHHAQRWATYTLRKGGRCEGDGFSFTYIMGNISGDKKAADTQSRKRNRGRYLLIGCS